MKNKEPYVVYQKCEMDFKLSPAELMVYLSIKSYCANGKREFGLSSRMIAERTSLSQPYVIEITRKLIHRGIVRIAGREGHLGGNIPVYQVIVPVISKVITPDISKSKISDNHSEVSDNSSEESDNYSGSKNNKVKSNKVSEEILFFYNSKALTTFSLTKQRITQIKKLLETYDQDTFESTIKKYIADPFWAKQGIDWLIKNIENFERILNLPEKDSDYSEGISVDEWMKSPNYIEPK